MQVDGVSSIGALDFQFDKWRVDVAVTGSQKALSLPTGLAVVCASKKVRVLMLLDPHHVPTQPSVRLYSLTFRTPVSMASVKH